MIPKSTKNAIVGWENDYLKIRLHALPEKGEANAVLIDFLSEVLDIPKSHISIIRGKTARLKELDLIDITQEELRARLLK